MTRKTKAACADIGHSMVKVVGLSQGKSFRWSTPSIAVRARTLDDEGAKISAFRDTVKVGGVPWWVGNTAALQGGAGVNSGLSADWVETPEHDALVVAAFDALREAGFTNENTHFMMGLPPKFMKNQRDGLKQRVNRVANVDINVGSQASGPYFQVMLDATGRPAKVQLGGGKVKVRELDRESWGVIEVGHFTTDFALIERGVAIQDASTSVSGVRPTVERLTTSLSAKYTVDELMVAEAMGTGTIRQYGQDVNIAKEVAEAIGELTEEISEAANRVIGSRAHKLDGIVLAGGGASLVAKGLVASRKWPHVVVAPDARWSVADGLARFALALATQL